MEIHIEELKRIMNESLNIKGRTDRRAFVTLLVFAFLVSSIATRLSSTLSSIVVVLLFIPQLTMNIRRLHDTNTSGKWLIVPYVLGALTFASFFLIFFNLPMFVLVILATSTLISIIYIGVKLLFETGDQEPNKYGAPLKRIEQLTEKKGKRVE